MTTSMRSTGCARAPEHRRHEIPMLRALLAFGIVLAAMALPASADGPAGRASVIDGDTLEIHETRIRLWGIDAPESDQLCQDQGGAHFRCGQKVANDVDGFIARRPVAGVEVDRDQYKRAVAIRTVAGIDLAEWLVKNGLALDWPQYSKDAYAPAQSEAKRANLGVSGGRLVEPWRFLQKNRRITC